MEPDEEDRLARHDRLGDELGRVELEPLVDVGRRDARHRGRPRGSSAPNAGRRSGRAVRGPSGRSRRPGRAGCPCRTPRATGRPGGGSAAPGPRGPGRAGTTGRRRAPRAGRAGPPGSRQASHDIASRSRPRTLMRRPRRPARRRRSGLVARRRPRAGPGSGRPACISRARRSRSAPSSAVAGQIGLKLYHCSGAAAIGCGDRVGDRLGRALEVGRVATARPTIGSAEHDPEPAVRPARTAIAGRIRRRRLGGERRGAGRQRRPGVEQLHRDAVAAVAPVDEQAEQLAAAQDAEDRPQVAPRDERRAPLLALAAEVARTARGTTESSATTLSGRPEVGDRRADRRRCCRRGRRSR